MPREENKSRTVCLTKKKKKTGNSNPCDVLSLYYKPVLSPLKPPRVLGNKGRVGWLVVANGCKSLQPYGNRDELFFSKNIQKYYNVIFCHVHAHMRTRSHEFKTVAQKD